MTAVVSLQNIYIFFVFLHTTDLKKKKKDGHDYEVPNRLGKKNREPKMRAINQIKQGDENRIFR